ncbi:hypothetical protein MTR_2g041500 [Medicago truncatula]|uniref:Uncharacterized protein n=1 Tax=Medicago truncatula TaxID=3880 RepID=A0A072V876_MEDTR|nr:hypothetical protein MTR_2g041500 [Medicago truncatula]
MILATGRQKRFSIEIAEKNNQDWQEKNAFQLISNRTTNFGMRYYPYAMFRQKYFAYESAKQNQHHLANSTR